MVGKQLFLNFRPLSGKFSLGTLAFIAVLIVAIDSRLFHLASIPGIYPDEIYYLEYAHNILHNRFEWGLFSHTFLPRLPLPLVVMGLSGKVFGANLFSVRLVCAFTGILTIVFLYLTAASTRNKSLALWAMFFLTIHPFVICYNRWGFPYNFLPLLSMTALLCGISMNTPGYEKKARIGLSISVALALLCEPIALALFVYGLLLMLVSRPRWIVKYCLISLTPIFLYVIYLWMLDSSLLYSDIHINFLGRLSDLAENGKPSIAAAFHTMTYAYRGIFWVGLIGLIFLPDSLRRQSILLCVLWLSVLVITASRNYTLLIRESIVLFPLAALGWAALVITVIRKLNSILFHDLASFLKRISLLSEDAQKKYLNSRKIKYISRSIVVVCCAVFVYSLLQHPLRFLVEPERYKTLLDSNCVYENETLAEAAEYISRNVNEDDLVLGDHLPRLLPCRKGSLMQMAVVEGARGNPFYPYDIFKDRRLGPWNLTDVKYVVLTPYNEQVEQRYPGVPGLMSVITKWPTVFAKNNIRIHHNPEKKDQVIQNEKHRDEVLSAITVESL